MALGAQDNYACALVYEHDGPASAATGWPWVFRATQRLILPSRTIGNADA